MYKTNDRVVKVRRYSPSRYCRKGGEEHEVPLGTAGEVIRTSDASDIIQVRFDNGCDWDLDKSELEFESIYNKRRCKMIDTKKLKKGNIIKVECDGVVGLFEIERYREDYDEVKCHGVSNVPGYDERMLEEFRKSYPDGNWTFNIKKIIQVLSNVKTIEVGDDVIVKRRPGKNWHHSGKIKDGSMGKVIRIINEGDDYAVNIDGSEYTFHKNEVMKTSTEFPKYAVIYDGSYEVSTWGSDLKLIKEEVQESIRKMCEKKAVIYELKPITRMQSVIKVQNIGKKTKTKR